MAFVVYPPTQNMHCPKRKQGRNDVDEQGQAALIAERVILGLGLPICG